MNVFTPLTLLSCIACMLLAPMNILASQAQTIHNKAQELHSGWQFRKAGSGEWLPADVPGMVHLDLLRNRKIPDPFHGSNEAGLQWIEKEDWEYRTSFVCDSAVLQHSRLDLVFDGLDTFASVYVNDSLLLKADNMFRTWRVDCKSELKSGRNELRIVFQSAYKKGLALSKHLHLTLPGDEKVFVRKAQYQFGWDWGPRFVSCGVWRGVRLEAWDDARLMSVSVKQESLNEHVAYLKAACELDVHTEGTYILALRDAVQGSGALITKREVTLKRGVQTVNLEWMIPKPQLWWSNGLGKPHLYKYICEVRSGDTLRSILDEKPLSIGLRTIKIVQRPDSVGASFYVELNGQPVFMKGANYIPPDSFLPRVHHSTYKRIVQDAARAKMNMLRVWGGGTYEHDDFYTLCDEHGILVWQDFMFACAMYPGDSAFVENVRAEAVDNVKRLRNHPCIALWCGNNEIDEGWKNWGWQKQYQYSAKDSAVVWHWYETLFHRVLPDVVERLDSGRFYWRSSPQFGWGRKESLLRGDAHYWGVWWGLEPFSMYENKVGRFMSEYGMQSLPALQTIAFIAPPEEQHLTSATMKTHQKHPTGYENIQQYLQRDYKEPKNFEQYVYVSQLLQARGITTAIEAHRRAKPYCMGTLYWQLNDCWQVASWSSVDYEGRWKALHYAVQDLYDTFLLSVERTASSFAIHLVSDALHDTQGALVLELRSFDGTVRWSKTLPITAKANSSAVCAQIRDTELPQYNKSESVLVVRFNSAQRPAPAHTLAEKLYYFVPPKDLVLQRPTIAYTLVTTTTGQHIELRSNTLAKNVFIHLQTASPDAAGVHLSTNFFDILPGDTKIVRIEPNRVESGGAESDKKTDKSISFSPKQILVQSLFDSY